MFLTVVDECHKNVMGRNEQRVKSVEIYMQMKSDNGLAFSWNSFTNRIIKDTYH